MIRDARGLITRLLIASPLTALLLAGSPSLIAGGVAQQGSASPSSVRPVLDQYCVTCHNQRLKTAGLALDTVELNDVREEAEVWEKVVRKLRTKAMPPVGRPRPDDATADAVASWLETQLDRAAAARPNPGRVPAVHRLSRREYGNAIRDLLAIEHFPKQMDINLLLPADNVSSGFDTLADLLFVSPTVLDSYLTAARKISRLAVGDPAFPLMINTHFLHPGLRQDEQLIDFPVGTRGGIAISTYLPLDGEYVLELSAGNFVAPEVLEISVDGVHAHRFTAEDEHPLEVVLPMRAGPRRIVATFVQSSFALGESVVRMPQRNRGLQPAITDVVLRGPTSAVGPGRTPSRDRIFVCRPSGVVEEAPCAEEILSTLARRAYRRPVNDADLQRLLPLYQMGRAAGGFEMGIQRALERILVSPQFLFRLEPDPPGLAPGTVYPISDLELASRLSFFIWSSIPDDELLDVAGRGVLKDPAIMERQVRRMLEDPRSQELVTNFAEQWLYLRDLESKRPDQGVFPDFDEGLRDAMQRETKLFLDSVLRGDQSVLDLVGANYTFVNERLAKHYGIENVYGSHFRRVTFDAGSGRGGLLGQGSILTLTSHAYRTSPVLRGKWILDNLLSAPPPPPPPNVPALRERTTDGQALSMREAMVQHRANPVCASCHQLMDPLGFALENFDALGRWRTRAESGEALDVSGVSPDGTKFEGVAGLSQFLVSQPKQFVYGMTDKLAKYALGREMEYYDAPAVRKIVREVAAEDYKFSSLVLGIVRSLPFRMNKTAAVQTPAPSSASAASASGF